MGKNNITQICSVDGCGDQLGIYGAAGMCCKHYGRKRKWGDVHMSKIYRPKSKGLVNQFWERVDIKSDDECWEWQYGKNKLGYGTVRALNRTWLAHRLMWFIVHGREAADCLLHSCDNPPCCNPRHLREGTRKENAADMVERGQMPIGERRGTAKLTDEKVRTIRSLRANGMGLIDIAKQFNVHDTTILSVCRYKTWKHVT